MHLHKHETFNVHVIAGLGNPLVDVSVILEDNSLLEKFNLDPDGQKEVKANELYFTIGCAKSSDCQITHNPGGCAQNTLRTVQKLVGNSKHFCVMFGGLGTDTEGHLMETQLNIDGVKTRYAKHSGHMTGHAVALINGVSRSLIAHLGAAEIYRLEDFNTAENLKLIQEVYIVYIEGFFITHSVEVALQAVQLCHTYGIVVVFNICGAYVVDVCPEDLITVARAADIVIGNKNEFLALANILKLNSIVCEEIVVKLHQNLWKENYKSVFKLDQLGRFGKTLIMTQGSEPVLCVGGDRKLVKYDVPYLDPKMIKDSTGAGDTFAAGFLVAFLEDKALIDCLAFGSAVAQEVIQNIGVDFHSWKFNEG